MELIPSTLHTQAAGEHEQRVEQNIRTLKDITRSIFQSVPYRNIPLLLIGSISKQVKYMIDAFPSKTGISTTLSARNILEGRPNFD